VVPVLVFSVCGLLWAAAAAASPMTQSPGVERFNRSQFVAATEWGRKSSTGRAPYGGIWGIPGETAASPVFLWHSRPVLAMWPLPYGLLTLVYFTGTSGN